MFADIHVLVVEDDDQTRELLADVLADAGFQVSMVDGYAPALDLVSSDTVDVVVSDIRLRGDCGIALLEAVRSRSMPPEVILLTGCAQAAAQDP